MNAQKLDKNECYINRFSCYKRPNQLAQSESELHTSSLLSLHFFLSVITSSNPIKILFGIRFIFTKKSLAFHISLLPHLSLLSAFLNDAEKNHLNVIGFMGIKMRKCFFFFDFPCVSFLFPLPQLFFGGLKISIFHIL